MLALIIEEVAISLELKLCEDKTLICEIGYFVKASHLYCEFVGTYLQRVRRTRKGVVMRGKVQALVCVFCARYVYLLLFINSKF